MHNIYFLSQIQNVQYHWNTPSVSIEPTAPCSPSFHCHQKYIYLRLLSYMLLDWAQILKGSGFLWMVPSAGESWAGRLGRGWEGGGGATLSLRGGARDGCKGESVWMLLWLETLCWELFWLSFRDNCCWRSTSMTFHDWKSAATAHLWKWKLNWGLTEREKNDLVTACSAAERHTRVLSCKEIHKIWT